MVISLEDAARRHPSPRALQTLGVAYLIGLGDGAVDRAVTALEAARRLAPENPHILSDLAAAYFVRAQRKDEPEDLALALARSSQAVERDGSLPEARFNKALALEALHLRSAAASAWDEYRESDATSPWGGEALRRRDAMKAPEPAELWKKRRSLLEEAARQGDEVAARRIVESHPQAARLWIEETVLPSWAEARAAGQGAEAREQLTMARTVGKALFSLGGDRMILDTVAAIEAVSGRLGDERRLAATIDGLRAYREGSSRIKSFEIEVAEERFRSSRTSLAAGSNPFQAWAEFQIAVCAFYRSGFPESVELLKGLHARAIRHHYLNLAGRTLWVAGLSQVAMAQPVEGLEAYRSALAAFTATREVESLTAVHGLLADSLRYLGEDEEAWRHRFQALEGISGLTDLRRRQAVLGEAGLAALELEEPLAAGYFQDEAVLLARRSGNPLEIAEALRGHAAISLRMGDQEKVLSDLREAQKQVAQLGDERLQQVVLGQMRQVEGRLWSGSDAQRAIDSFTAAVETFESASYRPYLATVYLERALVHRSRGEEELAEADLRSGAAIVEAEWERVLERRERIAGEDLWSSYFDKARDIFESLVELSAEQGRDAQAFHDAERSRARDLLDLLRGLPQSSGSSLASPGPLLRPLSAEAVAQKLPADTVLIEYAVLNDRLLTWVVRRGFFRMIVQPLGREGIEKQVARLRQILTKGGSRDEERRLLEALHTSLLQPVLPDLASSDRLVFVPDEALYAVPFSALLDPATQRYLIQDHAVAVAPSAVLYLSSLERDWKLARGLVPSALAVGNPTFDRTLFPLESLPGAQAEASKVASLYPGSELIQGEEATTSRFLTLARRHQVVHFGGHALTREESPAFSTLLLAPSKDAGESGVLYAHELLHQRFDHVRLFVLAVCGTSGRASGAERMSGFVRPLIGAGVPAVVASLWAVDDRETARMFVVFHQRFRAGDDASAALRAAQLDLLENPDESLRSTRTWAAFQVFGGTLATADHRKRRDP